VKSAGVLLLAAVLLGGCGDNGSADRKAIDAKFDKVDYAMSSVEISAPPYQENLTKLTQQYLALVREYGDELGDAEVKRRLTDKVSELEPFCVPCSGLVSDELAKHQ
jgi:hypothetical protein